MLNPKNRKEQKTTMVTLKKFYKDKVLLRNLLLTAVILAVIRLFYVIPTPGVNMSYFKALLESNDALSFMDTLTGNGLSNLSVMMLNVTPYITASIIMQLMSNVFTKLRDMQRGMRDEQKRYEKITVILGIILAFAESTALSIGYGQKGMFIEYQWYWILLVAAIWTAGAAFSSIMGKFIHDKFDLNGTSLILLLNILAGYPSDAKSLYTAFMEGEETPVMLGIGLILLLVIIALFIFSYYIQESERPIKINYSTKTSISGNKQTGEFPIKLCPGSVVPVIFASSIMTTPVLVASAFVDTSGLWAQILSPSCWFTPDNWLPTIGAGIYVLLIFGFSFYYVSLTMDPKEIAENLKKNGGTIAGIRPGQSTAQYLKKRIYEVVALGAVALIIIALIPVVLSGIFSLSRTAFLGTSVIITVGVMCEIKHYILAHIRQVGYSPVMNKGGLF